MLVVAMGLGMIVATALGKVLMKKEVAAETPVDPASLQEVYILKQKCLQGREIDADDVIIDHLGKNKVPRGSIKSFSQMMNRPLIREVAAGTILMENDFAMKTNHDKIKGFVPAGHQLVAVQVQESAGEKNKNIVPGDHVDVLLIRETDEKDAARETVLFEKIPVMDAIWDNTTDGENCVKGTISLMLSDEQKEDMLRESAEKAKLRLRVCPPINLPDESPMVNPLQKNFVQNHNNGNIMGSTQSKSVTEQQPAVLSTMLPNPTGEIYTVFHGEKTGNSRLAQSDTKLTPAVPDAKFGGTTPMAQLADTNSSYQLDVRTAPRYPTFYGENQSQWREITPQRPLVYEVPAGSIVPSPQQRGIYRSNGVYVTNSQ